MRIISPSKYKSFHALVAVPKSKKSSVVGMSDELISPPNAMLSVSASPNVRLPCITASPANSNLPKEPVVADEPDMSPDVSNFPDVCVSVTFPSSKFITAPLSRNRSLQFRPALPREPPSVVIGIIFPLDDM